MIVPMKKATLFALKQDRDVLLQALQRCGEFMIIPVEEGEELTGYETTVQEAQKVENTLGFILRYQGKKSFLQERTAVEYDRFMEEDPKAVALSEEAEALAQEMNAIRGEIEAAKGRAEQLEPWLPLDIPVSKLVPTQTARFFTGYLPLGGGADALAAAPGAGLDEHGIPDARGLGPGLLHRFQQLAARHGGHPGLLHQTAGRVLVPHLGDDVPVGADEGEVLLLAQPRESRVLRQKAVARMNGLRPGGQGSGQNILLVEIAVRRRGRAHADPLVRQGHVQRLLVRFGIDRHRGDAHLLAGADNPHGDFSPVGHQDF